MSRLLIAVALIAVAVGVAVVLRRRRPEPPTQPSAAVPSQLDRDDFDGPDLPWLIVVFSSATCASCQGAWEKVSVLAGPEVAVEDVPWQTRKDLHERYAIDTAPTIVVADRQGVVRRSFTGSPPAADLWAAVAEVRDGV